MEPWLWLQNFTPAGLKVQLKVIGVGHYSSDLVALVGVALSDLFILSRSLEDAWLRPRDIGWDLEFIILNARPILKQVKRVQVWLLANGTQSYKNIGIA